MKLDQIDEAVRLRNWREKAIKLREVADSAIDVKLLYYNEIDVASVISVECIREAIKAECTKMIGTWEYELKALGVEP